MVPLLLKCGQHVEAGISQLLAVGDAQLLSAHRHKHQKDFRPHAG